MANYGIEPKTGSLQYRGEPIDLRVLRNLSLEPARPFFRFVLTYLAASAGLTPMYDAEHYPDFMKDRAGVFPGSVDGDAQADLRRCVELVRGGALSQRDAEISLCCMLANTAYESLSDSDKAALSGTPEGRYFRHVRNAASHGNEWYFTNGQPNQPAAWRAKALDETRQGDGNPLQGKPCFHTSMMPADLLYLLSDIEKLLKTP